MFFRNLNWDIIGQRRIWFGLSLAVIAAGVVALVAHHGLRLGLSFTGGTTIEIKFDNTVTESAVRQALSAIDTSTVAGDRAQYDDIKAGNEGIQLAQKPGDK